jgi:formiminotetrahydrofolate cyclodeaminase
VEGLDEYLKALASPSPTPGGGSAATIVGALGAALVAMVARITRDNPKYRERAARADELAAAAESLRGALEAARQTDEEAYGRVVAAMALPRMTPEEKAARAGALQAALAAAASAPLRAAGLARDVLRLTDNALGLENPHLTSDLGCAAAFAAAAVQASAYNVRTNHRYLRDLALIAEQENALDAIERESATFARRIRRALAPVERA